MKLCFKVTLVCLALALPLSLNAGADDLRASSGDENLTSSANSTLWSDGRFLTYPFHPHPDMRLWSGWFYSDRTYHGAIDYIKGSGHYRGYWQSFDVLAAAGGTACWVLGRGKDPGPLVKIQHEINGVTYETLYGHLDAVGANIPRCPSKVRVRRGERIGLAGDKSWNRCPPPCVHLHFEFHISGRAVDPYGINGLASRYPQPEESRPGLMGGNHHWMTDPPSYPPHDTIAPVIHFFSPQPNRWYNSDQRIWWKITDEGGAGVRGFNQAWDSDPGGLPPQHLGHAGYLLLSWAGEGVHTAYVRAWDVNDNQAFVTRGWFGYDTHPPTPPTSALETHGVQSDVWQDSVNDPEFTWNGADDVGCGVAGYNVYWGLNSEGTAANWTNDSGYNPGPVAAGVYYLRVRTVDGAGSGSEWTTLFVFKYGAAP